MGATADLPDTGRLYGREAECGVIDRMLADARAGRSRAVVIRGEAGIGKTALLENAAASAAAAGGMRVIRTLGIEAESELPFAGLHLLVGPFTDRLEALPPRQADTLRGAFGLTGAPAGDRFLAGLAVLTLLSDLAEERPLLCLIDDAQWLDAASAEALLFAGRRLDAEGIALLLAARDRQPFFAPGIEEVHLAGLAPRAGAELLAAHAEGLAPQVRERIIEQAAGNPLALLELPAALTPEQHTGQLAPDTIAIGSVRASTRVQRTFHDRITALPEPARDLLLIAAADDTGDLNTMLNAARHLGAGLDGLDAAEQHGLIHISGQSLTFHHPLIRAAAYQAAPLTHRLAAHRALALALSDGDTDRRAWHLAAATTEPDETVAAKLESTAEHARTRGGYQAVAAAYERAAQLSPDPDRRVRRLVAAAQAAADAGQPQRAAALAARVGPQLTDPLTLARLIHIRASVLNTHGDQRTAHAMLLDGAAQVAPHNRGTAAFMFLDAMSTAWALIDPDLIEGTAARLKALSLPPPPCAPHLIDAIIGLADVALGRPGPGLSATRAFFGNAQYHRHPLGLRERASLQWWHHMVGDFETAHEIAACIEQECRTGGAIGVMPTALYFLSRTQTMLGRLRDAAASATEGLRIAQDTSQDIVAARLKWSLAYIAAIQGDADRCRRLAEELWVLGSPFNGIWRTSALGLLELGAGRHDGDLHRLDDLYAGFDGRVGFSRYLLPDFVELAIRAGRTGRAETAARRFGHWAEATDQPWVRAVALRCRALLTDGDEAGDSYARAIKLHRQDHVPFEQARTRLLYGEWLRRRRHSSDARPHLRAALETFDRLGAVTWAGRTRTELRATGETLPATGREPDLLDRLTPQELQVVRLASTGMRNRDIAARMFISPRTVGYHLYKAYPKLGIASRGELARIDLGSDTFSDMIWARGQGAG